MKNVFLIYLVPRDSVPMGLNVARPEVNIVLRIEGERSTNKEQYSGQHIKETDKREIASNFDSSLLYLHFLLHEKDKRAGYG